MKIGASMRLFPRENYLKKILGFYHDDGMIKVVTGVRRCCKSCLVQCIAEELRAEGIDDEHIVFFDLGRYGHRSTEEREYRPFEQIRDNYPKYLLARGDVIQQRDGIIHANIPEFMQNGKKF